MLLLDAEQMNVFFRLCKTKTVLTECWYIHVTQRMVAEILNWSLTIKGKKHECIIVTVAVSNLTSQMRFGSLHIGPFNVHR